MRFEMLPNFLGDGVPVDGNSVPDHCAGDWRPSCRSVILWLLLVLILLALVYLPRGTKLAFNFYKVWMNNPESIFEFSDVSQSMHKDGF